MYNKDFKEKIHMYKGLIFRKTLPPYHRLILNLLLEQKLSVVVSIVVSELLVVRAYHNCHAEVTNYIYEI